MSYPSLVCKDCGKKYQTRKGTIFSSMRPAKCQVCGEMKSVTEPRDFGYPIFPGFDNPWEKEKK